MNVDNKLAVPHRRANATALGTTVAVMSFLIDYEPQDVEPVEFMRASAVLLITMYAALHVGVLNALSLMAHRHIDHAQDALESYRDPRRLSHLDLAAAWLGFYALAPYTANL